MFHTSTSGRAVSAPGAPAVAGYTVGGEADRVPVAVDELADHVERLRQINARIKELTVQADGIKAAIQDALGDYEVGTVHGRPAVYWTSHIRHALDQKALKEQRADVYAEYLKASPYRRFVLVEESDDE